MPEKPRKLRVFLCHTSADKPKVLELYQRLITEEWIDPWLDSARILPGQHWTSVIRKSLADADSVIILISNNSINKEGFVQREMNYAWDMSLEKPRNVIYLIPLRLEDCEVPLDLRERQWADYFGEKKDETYNALLQSLQLRHEQKLGVEAEEQARQEKQKREREAAEKTTQEKAEQEAAEKVWLEPEELARQKAAKEKAERETAEKAAREKAEQDAAEKTRLEAKELARQKAAQEKAAREAAEKAAKIEKEVQREVEKRIKKAIRDLQWERFKSKIRYWLDIARIYAIPNILLLIGIAFAVYMFISYSKDIPVLNQLLNPVPQSSQVSTETLTPTKTFTPALPSKTPTPKTTLTYTPTKIALPTEITDDFGVEMALVPEGTFKDESGSPQPYLSAFYMDKYEVTNSLYDACVAAGMCKRPLVSSSLRIPDYYDNTRYKDYPVVYVDWYGAEDYCEWRSARLPESAEWEKAARGIEGRIYPWGNDFECKNGNFNDGAHIYESGNWVVGTPNCDGYADTAPVGSFSDGASPYGIYDMAGNVSEWVLDMPNDGDVSLIGGSYYDNALEIIGRKYLGVAKYFPQEKTNRYSSYYSGFRCIRDATP